MATTLSASAVRTGAVAIISSSTVASTSLGDGKLSFAAPLRGVVASWAGPTPLGRIGKACGLTAPSRRPTLQHGHHGLRECQHLNAVAVAAPEKADEDVAEDDAEEEMGPDSPLVPNALEIQSLLMELCDETEVAELKLKVGNFKLHVRRSLGKKGASAQAAWVPPPVPSRPMDELQATPARAAAPPQYETDEDTADIDEGLLNETAKKVGIFRRGKLYKGKSGRPIVNEGAVLKVGQVLGYLEQLGTYAPVEAEHGGEVVKFLVEDGDPVGYGDELVAVRPSFQGIKKGANLID